MANFGDFLSGLGTTAFQDVAVPYIQKQTGIPNTNELALQRQRNAASALNGSGPNDPQGALKSPNGLVGLILGQKVDGSGNVSYGVPWALLGIGALLVGAFFFFRKR